MAITDTDDLGSLTDQGLMDFYDQSLVELNRLTAERLVLMAEIHTRCLSSIDGHTATTTWLTHRHDLKRSVVARDLRLARLLRLMPATHMALESNEISVEHAHRLAVAHQKNPEMFARDEKTLLESIEDLSFARVCNVIRSSSPNPMTKKILSKIAVSTCSRLATSGLSTVTQTNSLGLRSLKVWPV